MDKPVTPSLTKICSNCGQQKPLTAFLEMSSTHGATYGTICAACRKTALERRRKTEGEGSTTSETGHKIDSKTKVHEDIGKREKFQQTEEEYHKERDIKEEVAEKVIEKNLQTERKEKKHREDFLDKRTAKLDPKKIAAAMEAGKKYADGMHQRAAEHQQSAANQAHGAKEEQKKTGHDFSIPYQGQQVAGQLRFQGQVFQQFRQWLGNSAPIVNNVNVTMKEVAPQKAGAITQSADQIQDTVSAHDKGEVKKTSIQKDPAIDFIEENFRPGKKR